MSNADIAERMSNRIKILTLAYEDKYGRRPETLFVPWVMATPLIALAENLCGRLLDQGFVLDSINGLSIRLVTGNRLGVGILSGKALELGRSTPIQDAIWYAGDQPPPHRDH